MWAEYYVALLRCKGPQLPLLWLALQTLAYSADVARTQWIRPILCCVCPLISDPPFLLVLDNGDIRNPSSPDAAS